MTITDTAGTHIFPSFNCSDLYDYGNVSRHESYTNIADLNSTSAIGSDLLITINFYQLTRSKLTELNDIFILNKSNNASITQIDNSDEVNTGETYIKFLGATNGIFIETKQWKQKKSVNTKDIQYWNTRLDIRFDTATTHVK